MVLSNTEPLEIPSLDKVRQVNVKVSVKLHFFLEALGEKLFSFTPSGDVPQLAVPSFLHSCERSSSFSGASL